MSGFYRWRSARCEIATAGDWMSGSHANHAVFPQGQCDTVTALLVIQGTRWSDMGPGHTKALRSSQKFQEAGCCCATRGDRATLNVMNSWQQLGKLACCSCQSDPNSSLRNSITIMELQKSALLNVQRADLLQVHPVVCLFVTMPRIPYKTL